MGQVTVKVPDVGEGIAEVELVSWAVSEGQPVERNQIIAEVMTDKATVEVPSPVDGIISDLTGGVGDILLVGSPLFALETDGPDSESPNVDSANSDLTESDLTASTKGTAGVDAEVGVEVEKEIDTKPRPAAGRPPVARASTTPVHRPEGRRPIATPAVRRRAREAGIDLRSVTGTGPAGRIDHRDLDALFAGAVRSGVQTSAGRSAGRAPNPEVSDQPIVGIRRKIAEQMVASASTIPHITYVEEVDMTDLDELRRTLNTDGSGNNIGDSSETNGGEGRHQPKLTVLPFLIRALVNELGDFPSMNAHVLDPTPTEDGSRTEPAVLRSFGGVHVGIATQTEGGLVVPVLHHAESETIWSTATRIGELADAARNGTADRNDLTGSTITITSLGALGGLVTTPVINKPETTIIGVNKMVVRPVWIDGEFVPRKMMNLSSSFDHRVIDGWDAARFVQALKRALEQPALLFVDRP